MKDISKISLEKNKHSDLTELISGLVKKLNETIEVINILKAENEVLKNKIEFKVSLKDIDNSLSKIKKMKNN